jgi:transcriptional regulator with XRE-family HTH domain
MLIGKKIKQLRLKNELTLEELANRTELSKGFLSQLERDLTTTSVQTLLDILEVLGTSPVSFFNERKDEKVIFSEDDIFVQETAEYNVSWLIPSAQKNSMEPILIEIMPGAQSEVVQPFEGEAFGYVLEGKVILRYGENIYHLSKNGTFYVNGDMQHYLVNDSNQKCKIIWIATPPVF